MLVLQKLRPAYTFLQFYIQVRCDANISEQQVVVTDLQFQIEQSDKPFCTALYYEPYTL